MKLVTFTHGGKTRVGAIVAEEVVDISGQGHDVPSDLLTFLEQGETAMHQAREVCASGRGRMALADVTLEAPIRRPPKILAVGLNYRDHIEETGRPMPEVPMIFNKQSTSITGPGGAIYRPKTAGSTISNLVPGRGDRQAVPAGAQGQSRHGHCRLHNCQ